MHDFIKYDPHKEANSHPKTAEYAEAIQKKTDELRNAWIDTLPIEEKEKFNALEKEIIPLLWKYKIQYMLYAWVEPHRNYPIQYHTLSNHAQYSKEYVEEYSSRIYGVFMTSATMLTNISSTLSVQFHNGSTNQGILIKNGKFNNL